MIWGVVLAAGRSRRMGQPKALLPVAGATFLERVVAALRDGGCGGVCVVVRAGSDEDAARIAAAARATGAEVVEVAAPDEQIHSLRAALRALDDAVSAVVVAPVDLPHLSAGVVAALIAARERSAAPVVVPVHGGKRGHPVLFARAVFPELQADPLPEGARTVVHAHAATLEEVPVTEPGVLEDVNTPDDFHRVVRRRP